MAPCDSPGNLSLPLCQKPALPHPEPEVFTAQWPGRTEKQRTPKCTLHPPALQMLFRHKTSHLPLPAGPQSPRVSFSRALLPVPSPHLPLLMCPLRFSSSVGQPNVPIPSCLTPSRPFFAHPSQPGAHRAKCPLSSVATFLRQQPRSPKPRRAHR